MGEVSEEYLWVARERAGERGRESEREEARGKQREGDTLKNTAHFIAIYTVVGV